MSDFRNEVGLKNLSKIHKSKTAPELQIHAAATLIMAGDPMSLNPDDRMDKTGEICQYCVPIDPQYVGQLSIKNIDNAFETLKQSIIPALRRAGVLRQGE